ncbi:Hypothetical protein PHPALM_11596 [Phytophthora palmivora]|uniref:Uncharacterized protein n=1 Tax=Phytophthora palmivora TaxID=4796 RepID=A0A2P4Y1U3_9STRA|nr:Hypothetical protein PHPALM_11596 [Phytophthora palmivora]
MDGLKVGPSGTQLFRVHANNMEEAIQIDIQEEYSHRQARTPTSVCVQEDYCDLAISQNHFATMIRETSVVGDRITNDTAESRSIRGSVEFWEELYRRNRGRYSYGPRREASASSPGPLGDPAVPDLRRDLQGECPLAKANQMLASKPSTKKKSSFEIAYHKKELHTYFIKNPVMHIISNLKGPVQKPTAISSKLEAAKALLQLIKEGGIIAGSFDANDLFDTRLGTINTAFMSIFDQLKPLVGEKDVTPRIATRSTDDMLRSLPTLTLEDQTGTSSHYQSATEEVDADSADDPPRMTQGSSGAAMLR